MSRLRWQLTVSHLIAIAFTLVCMIAAVLLIASAWWTRTSNASVQPADDARLVTASIQNVARRELDHPTGELSSILGLLASGDLQLPSAFPCASWFVAHGRGLSGGRTARWQRTRQLGSFGCGILACGASGVDSAD
jgi:hypothetical protein